MVITEIGRFVPGTTAKFVVSPVFKFVNKNEKASENWHWKFPYSSEANTKSKLKLGDMGVKSNSNTLAFEEFIVMPDWAKVFSKSISPGQFDAPSLKILLLGPVACSALPVLKITPLWIGKFGFVF